MDEKKEPFVISRRSFVGGVAAATGFLIVPRRVLGGPGYQAPSDTVNVATVGYIQGMGANNARSVRSENMVALCDVDESEAAIARMKRSKEPMWDVFPKATRYKDFRVMLEKQKDIDAVIVATPDHTHAVVAMASMQLGKHVYVQKPLTRTISEARALMLAARQHKVVTQMGNQGHSGEGVRLIQEWIDDGAIGKVREVHCWTNRPIWPQGMPAPTEGMPVPAGLDWDLWIGPGKMRPFHRLFHPFSWRSWIDYGGGALADMACHVMDPSYTVLKLGYPTTVQATVARPVVETTGPDGNVRVRGVQFTDSYPQSTIVRYEFAQRSGKLPAVKLTWYDGGLLPERPAELEPERRLPESGTIFVGEKGKLMCETYGESPRLIPESRMQKYKRPKPKVTRIKDGAQGHEMAWIDAIKGKIPPVGNFDYASPFSETVLLGNVAIMVPNTRLVYDSANMKISNSEEANKWIHHQYREGWSLGTTKYTDSTKSDK
jgi:predicted dehydrogenase